MNTNSLAFRLFTTAAAWVLLVLPVAGAIIYSLYRTEVETSFDRRLSVLLTVILQDGIDHGEDEPGDPKDVGEPLFEITHSGWYWQFRPLDLKPPAPKPPDTTKAPNAKAPPAEPKIPRTLKSRSLANADLPLPSDFNIDPNDREIRWANLEGPLQQWLRVAETNYVFGEGKKARRYSVAVGGTLGEMEASLGSFRTRLSLSLALAGVGLLAVTLFQIRFGLLPLHKVEQGLAAIRSGAAVRLDAGLPQEIEPLQHELNALLKSNQEIVERARTHVGNLAHALKTPLAVMVNEARDDPSPLARKVAEQAELMHTQVNLYLERARMAARIGVIGRVTEVGPVAESIIRALERIYRDRQLTFTVDCPAGTRFQGERQDLEEMLGNLLDNAAKWAGSKVLLTAIPIAGAGTTSATGVAAAPAWLQIRVDDDGPGLTPEQLAEPILRGRRLDETKPGSGLGHSIVADLAHTYGGKLELQRAEAGGLSARLTLPLVV
jgi:signal transduction histidine kinase